METLSTSPLAGVRSILETPILDSHKWGKLPKIPTDAALLDLEDSVQPNRKLEARERVIEEYLSREALGNRVALPRVNALDTPWGADDLRALRKVDVEVFIYPKVRTIEEIEEVRDLAGGAEVVLIIESAPAVLNLAEFAGTEGVIGLINGQADLSNDVGWQMYTEGQLNAEAYNFVRAKLALAAAAYGIPVYDTVFVTDLRDTDQVREAVVGARRMGFDGVATFYPPHVEIINEVFTPTEEEVAAARATVSAYEEALDRGDAALSIDGEAIIVQYYKRALDVLERAGER